MLDSDLAKLYEIPTFHLNQAVKRNKDRFPPDFMFQLTKDEFEFLKSQIVISKNTSQLPVNSLRPQIVSSKDGRGGRRTLPYVFSEHGILMLSSVLNSSVAVDVNIKIMRVFVELRKIAIERSDTKEQIADLRRLLMLYMETNDKRVNDIIEALNKLFSTPSAPAKRIGFAVD